MEATLTNNTIATGAGARTVTTSNKTQVIKKKSDSLEFLSGVFYIFKKVFLLG